MFLLIASVRSECFGTAWSEKLAAPPVLNTEPFLTRLPLLHSTGAGVRYTTVDTSLGPLF